jgi:glycosyltransferase involved in cell wall biosynthesis
VTTDVVLVIDSLEVGGAQRQLSVLARALARLGYAVAVVEVWPARAPVDDFGDGPAVTHVRLFPRRAATTAGRLAQLASAPFALRRRLARLRPVRVYSMLHLPNLLAWCATRGALRDSLVWGYRQSEMALNWKRQVLVAGQRWVSPSVPLMIANSNTGARYARERLRLRPGRIAVVPNGIDTETYTHGDPRAGELRAALGAGRARTLIGMVGRIDPMKDHETFLQAAARLSETRPEVGFVCVGEGPPELTESLRRRSARLGLDRCLTWLPARNDMPAVYGALDLLVLPSREGEGFPNVVAEAMACATPCVVTDVGDSAAIVADTGEVVAPGDPEGLAAAILRMLDGSPADTGERARARIAAHFTPAKLAAITAAELGLAPP